MKKADLYERGHGLIEDVVFIRNTIIPSALENKELC